MEKREEFLKAVEAERNGELSKDELFTIVKRIASEIHPKLSAEDVEKCAKMMLEMDMSDDIIMIGGADGPAYGESPEIWLRNENKAYKDKFFKSVEAARNGEIDKDELFSVVSEIVPRLDPLELAQVVTELEKITLNNTGEPLFSSGDTALHKELLEDKKMDISPETQVKLDKLLAKVDELIPPVDTVRLKPSRGKTTVFDSKLGGVPYLPKSMEYPTVREGELAGRPLFLLAQLNFGSLPKLPGFPTEGILQFFAGCMDDDVYGMDFDDGFNQNGFRVIYHENIITDESALYSEEDMPDYGEGDDYFPFKGEFLLTAEKAEPMGISETDFRFDKAVAAAYNELFGGEIVGMWDRDGKGLRQVDEPLYDAVFSRYSCKTRMGGYPFFTQEDPRRYNDDYAKCTVMLFQSDSENGGEKDDWNDQICWGDLGVANFFISPEDLAKRDFSHVLYNWDCG